MMGIYGRLYHDDAADRAAARWVDSMYRRLPHTCRLESRFQITAADKR